MDWLHRFPGLRRRAGLAVIGAIALAAALHAGRVPAQITPVPSGPYAPTNYTLNGVLFGNGSGAVQVTAASTGSSVLCGPVGAPSFCSIPSVNQLNGNSSSALILLSASVGSPITFQTGSAVQVREQVRIADLATTVNYLNLYGRTTGANPVITVNGSDPNVGLTVSSKGTGNISLDTGAVFTGDIATSAFEQVRIVHTASASNALTLTGSNGGNPTIGTVGGGNVAISTGIILTAPNTQTGATYTIATSDNTVIANRAGTITMTFPTASGSVGRRLRFVTIQAQTVVSAASNVVPLAGGAAGTAILAATAGKWADLECDGTNWIITASN